MNIFILSGDPYNAAIWQCDAHVVKMVLESTQLLCNCFPPDSFHLQYARTHYNHPCSIWARESIQNYNWLYDHTFHLMHEYNHRYGRVHKCHSVFRNLPSPSDYIQNFEQTPFALAMPIEFYVFSESTKGEINAIESYRKYYHHKRESMKLFRYTNRSVPEWLAR
jgi:hypothetical protein